MKSSLLSILCVFFIFTLVAVDAADFEITSGSELSYGGRNTHKQGIMAKTVTIKNNILDTRIENLQSVFSPQNNFQSSGIQINDTPSVLNKNGDERSVTVYLHPEDFDIVDEDLEERGAVQIGTLKFTGTLFNETSNVQEGSLETSTIVLKLELKNDLAIVSIEIQPPDGDFESIAEDSTKTITVDEDYDLKFQIRNTFESSSDIILENINIQILSDDLDIDKTTSISEITAGDDGEKTTTLSVSETGTGQVKILVQGDDQWGGKHGKVFSFDFRVEEPEEEQSNSNDADGDGVLDSVDECPDTITICDVDETGCPIDSDEDGTCDALDPTPLPQQQITQEEEVDISSGNDEPLEQEIKKTEKESADTPTSGFIPFLIGFAVGIMVTAGFSVLIKS